MARTVYQEFRRTLLIVLAGCLTGATLAQTAAEDQGEFLVDFWSTEEGLPSNTISGIAQTPDGYLWCSTYDGLVRFDGVRFLRVGPDSTDRQVNRLQCLFLDSRGRLWTGTDGAGFYEYHAGKFTLFSEAEGSPLNVVRAFAEDNQGNIWVGSKAGLGRLKNGKVSWYTEPNGYTNAAGSIWNLAFDEQRQLWIADWVSVKTFREEQFEPALIRPEVQVPVRALHVDNSRGVWVGSFGHILRRDPEESWKSMDVAGQFANTEVVGFCESRSGDLWVGTRKGLFRQREGKWVTFPPDNWLARSELRAIFEDREGNLWVGTAAAGLARLKRRLVTTVAEREGLTDDAVLVLCEDRKGELWAGLEDGRVLHGKPGQFRKFPGIPSFGADAPIRCILESRDDALWIGTFGNGLMRFKNGRRTDFIPSVGTRARVDKVTALLEDRNGQVWVGTFYALYKATATNILVPVGGPEVLAQVTALLEDKSGAIWVAYYGLGVARMAGETITWLTRREGLPTHFVRALHQDNDGALWVGTTAGLSRWQADKMSTWTTAEGLVSDNISQIVEDNSGHLWLGSKQGVMRVSKSELDAVAKRDKALLEVFNCGRAEGMKSEECSAGFSPGALKSKDERLWFPTKKGLVMVNPADLAQLRNVSAPPVYIEETRVDGKLLAAQSQPPTLPYGARRIEFTYTALSLTAPERIRFKRRLEGYESDWFEAGTARTAAYANLQPGQYRFQVIASNHEGLWNSAGQTFSFRIAAPFWRAWWFITLVGMSLAGGLGGAIRIISVRHLQRKLRRLEEVHAIEKERMRIAQDMHDEIGGKLGRISFLSDLARRNLVEESDTGKQIDEVSEAARDVIRTVDEIVWAVSPRNDTLESLAHYICRHAEEFFELTSIELQLKLPDQFPPTRVSADVRHNLFCAVKEALNNVLKHSSASSVRVEFAVSSGVFQVTVADDGNGFQNGEPVPAGAVPPRTGNGLLNMRERIQAVRGSFDIRSERRQGTTVLFSVPLR
jgi:ligand-binding sensor domain-containing protein/signal transduction histidine kinase